MSHRVPIRLLVHFRVTEAPLVQLTEGVLDGERLRGAGTRAINLNNPAQHMPLLDADGHPTGETVTVAHVLLILQTLARRHP